MCILFLPFDRCYMILPCYFHSIDIYVASFTGYKDDTFEVIFNLYVQGFKLCEKFDKLGRKSLKKMIS